MLICPDWHPPTFVMDGKNGGVVYGNMPFLRAVHRGETLRVLSDKVIFRASHFDREFKNLVSNMLEKNTETAMMVGRSPGGGPILSVTVRNPQGLMRTVLERGATCGPDRERKLVVEIRMADSIVDPAALSAFRDTLDLDATEFEALRRLVGNGRKDALVASQFASRSDETVVAKLQQFAGCLSVSDLQQLIFTLSPLVPSYQGAGLALEPDLDRGPDDHKDEHCPLSERRSL